MPDRLTREREQAMASFGDEYELQRIIRRCHDVVWERHGMDPAQAFDELSKLLYVRLYDETTMAGARTSPRAREEAGEFASRVRWLYEEARRCPHFNGIFGEGPIRADDLAVLEVFRQLSGFSLLETSSHADGADVKGTMYEGVVGNTFRGELGQFFTHRNLVEFMVRLVGVDQEKKVYDPACGSGGFLVMCGRLVRADLAARGRGGGESLAQQLWAYGGSRLFGTEINERTARVARLNMLMHGLSYVNVFHANALRLEQCADPRAVAELGPGSVDIVFANPPFAGYEKNPAVLQGYSLGRNGSGLARSVTREVLFLERILDVLREGGVAGVVLPQGILSNRNLHHVREFVRERAILLAVVELPEWAFIPSGTSVRGSIVFLQKCEKPPRTYDVFMKRVDHIGFTSTGRRSEGNELPRTVEEYRARIREYMVPVDKLEGRFDAKFYIRAHRRTMDLFEGGQRGDARLLKLSEIGEFGGERVNARAEPEREILLVETSGVNPETLSIQARRLKGKECGYSSLRVLRKGDILISRRRAYRGAVVVVPAELEGALAIPEFSVLRLHGGYDVDFVVEILRSAEFLELMTIYSTGEMSGRIAEKDLRELRIPVPEDHARYGAQFRAHRMRMAALRRELAEEEKQLVRMRKRVLAGDSDANA